jgi:hypothetical protein
MADFRSRMKEQFNQQLKSYEKEYRRAFGLRSQPHLALHAEWTALAFGGMTWANIGRFHKEAKRYSVAPNAVEQAVTRFAKAIQLTLLPGNRQIAFPH